MIQFIFIYESFSLSLLFRPSSDLLKAEHAAERERIINQISNPHHDFSCLNESHPIHNNQPAESNWATHRQEHVHAGGITYRPKDSQDEEV